MSASVGAVLTPAGLDKSVGLITAIYLMDPADPQWKNDPAFKAYKAWFEKYYPEGDIKDVFNVAGYLIAEGVVQVLKMCGDDLSRENVMKQMASHEGPGGAHDAPRHQVEYRRPTTSS